MKLTEVREPVQVSIKGVRPQDWAFLTAFAETHGLTMAELIQVVAAELQERSKVQSPAQFIQEQQRRRIDFIRKAVFGDEEEEAPLDRVKRMALGVSKDEYRRRMRQA